MQLNKKNISKELIIRNALILIEENRGIKDVNLRGIAKRIGCNHTNLYNYFDSLDEIFWEALGKALIDMTDYVYINSAAEIDLQEKLYLSISNIISFAMEHPGLYRLIWLESLNGKPSSEITNILHNSSKRFITEIIDTCNSKLTQEKAEFIANIIQGYLHGELCKWINNRILINDKDEIKDVILSNFKHVYQLLIKEDF